MRIWHLVGLLLALALLNGCSWQRIPPAETYPSTINVPLVIGVELGASQASGLIGPQVIDEWRQQRLFTKITYPYRLGDAVDAVMKLNIEGGASPNTGASMLKGALVGATFGLLGTVLGPSMDMGFRSSAVLESGGGEIGRYVTDTKMTAEWGLFANGGEVAKNSQIQQVKTIAAELAKKMGADNSKLVDHKISGTTIGHNPN